ncbi:hypothetical protein ACOSB0_00320, partial [Candidatus Phytoplasma citri]
VGGGKGNEFGNQYVRGWAILPGGPTKYFGVGLWRERERERERERTGGLGKYQFVHGFSFG